LKSDPNSRYADPENKALYERQKQEREQELENIRREKEEALKFK